MSHRKMALLFSAFVLFEGEFMSETVARRSVSEHPKLNMCRGILELFCKHEVGTLGRFMYIPGKEFLIEPVSAGNLSNWKQSQDGGFRRLPREVSMWEKDDIETFCRQVESREFYFEVRNESVYIFKNKDS